MALLALIRTHFSSLDKNPESLHALFLAKLSEQCAEHQLHIFDSSGELDFALLEKEHRSRLNWDMADSAVLFAIQETFGEDDDDLLDEAFVKAVIQAGALDQRKRKLD